MIAALFFASALTVVDGGTLRVNGEPIRLLAIEAPDIINRCRKRKACPQDNSRQSRESLKRALRIFDDTSRLMSVRMPYYHRGGGDGPLDPH